MKRLVIFLPLLLLLVGASRWDGDKICISQSTTNSRCIASTPANSGALDFGSIAQDACADLTLAVTGAAVNSPVACSYPAALAAGLAPSCWVTATDTVTFRLCNNTAGAIDPASGTFAAQALNP